LGRGRFTPKLANQLFHFAPGRATDLELVPLNPDLGLNSYSKVGSQKRNPRQKRRKTLQAPILFQTNKALKV